MLVGDSARTEGSGRWATAERVSRQRPSVAAKARISRSTSASFDRNMKGLLAGRSTTRAVGNGQKVALPLAVERPCGVVLLAQGGALLFVADRVSGGHVIERSLRLVDGDTGTRMRV